MIDVTCAIIRNEENEVLVVRRAEKSDHPLKWEFPGGKTNNGESNEECIVREIQEELSMDIVICGSLEPVEYDYGIKQIKLIPFICDTLDDLPILSEHIAYRWIKVDELKKIDFCEADIEVALQYLTLTEKTVKAEVSNTVKSDDSVINDAEFQKMIDSMMSLKEVDWIATSAVENSVVFNKLLEFSYSKDRKLAFRASWTLTKVCDKFPELIYPHMPRIVETIPMLDNESAQRSFLRIISLSDLTLLTGDHHGILAEHCFSMLKSGVTAIAIKAYSMEILYNLSLIYPELANELATCIKILMEDGSAGITSRGRAILKKIGEIPLDR